MYIRRKYVKAIKIIVCILISVVVVFGVFFHFNENFRVNFMNYMLEINKLITDFNFSDNGGTTYSDSGVDLGYVPTGFEPVEIQKLKRRSFLRFASGEFYFDITVNGINGNYSIDTENAVVEQIKINNLEGICSSKENANILLWHDDERVYRITANISKDEIIKIAENLQINDI